MASNKLTVGTQWGFHARSARKQTLSLDVEGHHFGAYVPQANGQERFNLAFAVQIQKELAKLTVGPLIRVI